MKVIQKYNQIRRDCWCDLKCENCGHQETYPILLDDNNFWINVVPNFKCEKCGLSTKDQNLNPTEITLKYDPSEII